MITLFSLSYVIDMSHLSSLFDDKLEIDLWEENFSQSNTLLLEADRQWALPEHIWRHSFHLDTDDTKLNIMALKAVDKLKSLLKFSESEVAELVEVSRNSIRNWRKGQGAYPSTTNKLFQISHLISALNTVMNQKQMLTWLNESGDDPALSRLEQLRQSDGVSSVTRQANHLLFPPRPGKIPPQDMLVLESDFDAEPSVYAPNIYKPRSRPQVSQKEP